MAKSKSQSVPIETGAGRVSGILDLPAEVIAGVTLAHGAGAGMHHSFMVELAAALTSAGFAVLRFQFPYMEAGRKRTDTPAIAAATVAGAVEALRERLPKGIPIFAAGKSFGARMTTTAAAENLLGGIGGIICYGFPLHPAGAPDTKRAQHLAQVPMRMLFLQGTRDELADLELMREVCVERTRASLHVVEGADHGFAVLKRSGRTAEEVMEELVRESRRFVLEK